MSIMRTALLLLLAAVCCTAAVETQDDMVEAVTQGPAALSGDGGYEEILTEILDDIDEIKDISARHLHGLRSTAQRARGNTVYHVFNERKTYAQAQQTCQSINGQLADIKSMDLQKFIEGLIRGVDSRQSYWFGLSDQRVERVWTWTDGTPISNCDFSYWAPGEPNDGSGGQDCGQLWAYAGFKWDDVQCNSQLSFVCQVGPGEENACIAEGSCLKLSLPSGSVTGVGRTAPNYGPETVFGGSGITWNPQNLPRNYNNWWIVFDMQKTYTFSSIKVRNYGDTTHDVTAFKLETSEDKSTWTQVFSTGGVRAGVKTLQPFQGFYGTGRYWRFTATRTATGWQPWLVKLQFCGIEGRPNHKAVAVPGGGITGAGNTPTNGPEKTVDGLAGTFWNPQGLPRNHNNWWIIFDFQTVYTLVAMQITNFGDTTHDVTAFKLEASDDKVTWNPVYSTTGVRPGTKQPQLYGGFSGTGRYWRFTATRTSAGWQPWLVGLKFYTIPAVESKGEVQGDTTQTHFQVMGMAVTAQQARDYCREHRNGHLADIKSAAVHDFVVQTIRKYSNPNENFWIGLQDSSGTSGWKWADGTALTSCSYKNWSPSEPDPPSSGQQCVQMDATNSFSWKNDYCNTKKFFICQTGPGDTRACGNSAREIGPEFKKVKEEMAEDVEEVLEELKEVEVLEELRKIEDELEDAEEKEE
ncbi:NCAN [Branchiostoma lanceolatum]|uniref:NCAN protein n=1 Tax=Branchiostoma lanceolatum TaxID=7740 RepID=A0A8J9ZJ80_BRALA|nr:NCAN [Branchiostoma lanceolatum]